MNIDKFVSELKTRSRMYVPASDFTSLVCVFGGYLMAQDDRKLLDSFHEFLNTKCGRSSLVYWARIENEVENESPFKGTDEEKKALFFLLLEEWLEECQS